VRHIPASQNGCDFFESVGGQTIVCARYENLIAFFRLDNATAKNDSKNCSELRFVFHLTRSARKSRDEFRTLSRSFSRFASLCRFFGGWALLWGAHSGSSFSELGPNPIAAPEKHAHNTGVHIVTLFAHRALLAEIDMIFVRFPD
jgi:hypothetical protein